MGRRGRPPLRIAWGSRLTTRKTRISLPQKKQHNMSRGRGGGRRILRGRTKMSVSNHLSRQSTAISKNFWEDVSHCKSISEIQAINPSIQSELEKVMEIFSEEEDESKSSLKEIIVNGTLDSKEESINISKVKNEFENEDDEKNFDFSAGKHLFLLPEDNLVQKIGSVRRKPDSVSKLPHVKHERRGRKPLLKDIVSKRESIRSGETKTRNGKVRGIGRNGFVSFGQQRGHKYLNMLSKRNRLNMYKMNMEKQGVLKRYTRSLGASPNVNMNISLPDAKSRKRRKDFRPKSKTTITDIAKEEASNTYPDSSQPGTSKGYIQSCSSNDVNSLPTILQNSVIQRNSDSEMDEEEDIDCAKRGNETASREMVDVIDGIAFVTFENEHDMVRFTRSATEESPSKSDGTDRRSILESLGAIIPRKTKDIRKIKGWQRKKFSVSLNPMIESMIHESSLQSHDDDTGNIVFEHNYIRRLSGDLESESMLKSVNANGDQNLETPVNQSESFGEQSPYTFALSKDEDETISSSSEELNKSIPDVQKKGDWKQSATSAFVSYHPENQAKIVQSLSENLPVPKKQMTKENSGEEKSRKSKLNEKILPVNGVTKMGKRRKLIKSRRNVCIQVDLPEAEMSEMMVHVGDTIKYPSYDWLTTYNNNWDIDLERAVFATSALVVNVPVKRRKKKRIPIENKFKGGYSLRKRMSAINRRRILRSTRNGAPVRITRALSNILSPPVQSPLHSSSELASSTSSSPLPIAASTSDSKKSVVCDEKPSLVKTKQLFERNAPAFSHSSEGTHGTGKQSLINLSDTNSLVTSSDFPINHDEDSSENFNELSQDNDFDRKSSPYLQQDPSDNAKELMILITSKREGEDIKDSLQINVKDGEDNTFDEFKIDNEVKIKSSKMKLNGPDKDMENIEWEISRKSNMPRKEMSPDQDHEDIRVFLRPKPRFQGNPSVSTPDPSTFSSRVSEPSFTHPNNISPQKSSDMEVIKSRSPRSPTFARKKLIRELMKLNANFVSVDEKPVMQKNKVCTEEFCKLGCVCESINTEKRVIEHCGRIECMFTCICPTNSNTPKLQVIGSDTVSRLQEESSRGMAKIEKDFHNTVVEADGELVLPGRRQRERRVPKRFLDDESINPESLFPVKKPKHLRNSTESAPVPPKNELKVCDIKKKDDEVSVKQCKIPVENLPIPDLPVRCLNHFTVDCTCINKFPRNIAVKSTTPRNLSILSKTPKRIPDFISSRSNADSSESIDISTSELEDEKFCEKYYSITPTKALYVHHIQGDEVVSVKIQNTDNVRETLPYHPPKVPPINSNVETVLLTSCARTVGIDLWSSGNPSYWKNRSHNLSLKPLMDHNGESRPLENISKAESEYSSETNEEALEEDAPMFKIVDVKSLPPDSFDPTIFASEGVDQAKYFTSYDSFYSWIYSSHTMCQDLNSICSTSISPLPVNSVKLMKWKDLNNLIKNHSAHMWFRQRIGSKPRIYVTEKDFQPDAGCVNFLDLERKEEGLTAQVSTILKSAREDLLSEHSCCILISRGYYWAVAGNINLEKHSANKKLQTPRPKMIPRILLRKSTSAQTDDSIGESSYSTENKFDENSENVSKTPMTETSVSKINPEFSPKISTALTSGKGMCSSNTSENLDPDQILSDIETALPDILEGLVPGNYSGITQDNSSNLNNECLTKSTKLCGDSLPSKLPVSTSGLQFTTPSVMPRISVLKPRSEGNSTSYGSDSSVEVSITHLSQQDSNKSSNFNSALPAPEVIDRLSVTERTLFSRIVGMSQTGSSNSSSILIKPSNENSSPATIKALDNNISVSTSLSDFDKSNSKISSTDISISKIAENVPANKFIPLSKGVTVIGEGGKIISNKDNERKELPLEMLSKALNDPSQSKLRTDPPPVLIINLKKLRKGPNSSNEPVKIPVRVTNLKTLAQGLSEPKNRIDNLSSKVGKESNNAINNGSLTLQESGGGSKILSPERSANAINGETIFLSCMPKALTPSVSPAKLPLRNNLSSCPPINLELRNTNESSPSSLSQKEEIPVSSRDFAVPLESSKIGEENLQKVITSPVEDKNMSVMSQNQEMNETNFPSSAVETNLENSVINPSQKSGAAASSPLISDNKTGFSLPSSPSELQDDKQKHLENDLIWYRLYLNHKFDRLVFSATSFSASEKRIISAVEMARSSNRTVRISFNKNANSYLEFRKGIYAVPTIEEKYVRIGPFAKDEPTGVLLLKKEGTSYKPVPNLLVKEIEDNSSCNASPGMSEISPCLEKLEKSPNPSNGEQKNESDNILITNNNNLNRITFDSEKSFDNVPQSDINSTEGNNAGIENFSETNEEKINCETSVNNVEPEKTEHSSFIMGKGESEQSNITSENKPQSSKDSNGSSNNENLILMKPTENDSEIRGACEGANDVAGSISSNVQFIPNNVESNPSQPISSSLVINQPNDSIMKICENFQISVKPMNCDSGVGASEASNKEENTVPKKTKVNANLTTKNSRESLVHEDSADLPIKIQCVEGNFRAYGDLPSCNPGEQNGVIFENSCNESKADPDKLKQINIKVEKEDLLESENYRYLSSEIIDHLRRKKLFGSLSIEPIFPENPQSSEKNKICEEEQPMKLPIALNRPSVAKKSTAGRMLNPSVPVNGYMIPDIPNLTPIVVKRGLTYSFEDPLTPGQYVEVPDVSTMNTLIDDVLRKRASFFPDHFKISWTFVRAEKSTVPAMVDIKDITKDMFISPKGVLNYADYSSIPQLKRLGLDRNEICRYFELKRKRETEQAKIEVASLLVPKDKASALNMVKVLRKTLAEIKILKESEENLSQMNLIETKKKLQLEEKCNALKKGTLTLYTPPVHAAQPIPPLPSSPTSCPAPSLPIPSPLSTMYRPTRGRPPKRSYFRGRWRGCRAGRTAAPRIIQTRETVAPAGVSMQPRNPVGRPRRGRPPTRRLVTRDSFSMPVSKEISTSTIVESIPTSAVQIDAPEVENVIKRTDELTPPKGNLTNKALPITSASPNTVRNLIATIICPKELEKKVPDVSDKNTVHVDQTISDKCDSQESCTDDSRKQDEEKANGQVNALLWKESFSKVKVATENPLPPSKDKLVDPKERMKKILAENQDKLLQKLSFVPSSSKNLSSWSVNPSSPPGDSV